MGGAGVAAASRASEASKTACGDGGRPPTASEMRGDTLAVDRAAVRHDRRQAAQPEPPARQPASDVGDRRTVRRTLAAAPSGSTPRPQGDQGRSPVAGIVRQKLALAPGLPDAIASVLRTPLTDPENTDSTRRALPSHGAPLTCSRACGPLRSMGSKPFAIQVEVEVSSSGCRSFTMRWTSRRRRPARAGDQDPQGAGFATPGLEFPSPPHHRQPLPCRRSRGRSASLRSARSRWACSPPEGLLASGATWTTCCCDRRALAGRRDSTDPGRPAGRLPRRAGTGTADCCCRRTTSARPPRFRASNIYGVRSLPDAVSALNNPQNFGRPLRIPPEAGGAAGSPVPDFADVHGQLLARRCAGNRRCRRAQHAARRPARRRKDHDGAAAGRCRPSPRTKRWT